MKSMKYKYDTRIKKIVKEFIEDKEIVASTILTNMVPKYFICKENRLRTSTVDKTTNNLIVFFTLVLKSVSFNGTLAILESKYSL